MRVILYTGKGGVGKTSIAAATAVLCAEAGLRTVVMSTDAAHSLADALERRIGIEPEEVMPNLYAQEIDVNHELGQNWGRIQGFVTKFLHSQGMEDTIAEEFAVLPGMDELFSLLRLRRYLDAGSFDVAVVDCAPTANTVRMLSLPEVFDWYMKRFFQIERRVMKAVKPVVERIAKAPMPDDSVYDEVEELYGKVRLLKEMLADHATTTIRVVCNPERMVIRESQRVYGYLSLFGFLVDAVIMNRVLPQGIGDSCLGEWLDIQKQYIAEAEECFAPLPLLKALYSGSEMLGVDKLRSFGREVFGDAKPELVLCRVEPVSFEKIDGRYQMKLRVPGTTRDEVDLWKKGDELILKLRNYRRNIILPRTVAGMEVLKATLKDGCFIVTFGR